MEIEGAIGELDQAEDDVLAGAHLAKMKRAAGQNSRRTGMASIMKIPPVLSNQTFS